MTARYKALLAGLTALAVVLAVVLVWSLTRPTQPAAEPPVASSAEPTYNPSAGDAHDDHAHDPAEDHEAAWRPAVEHFARNFTDTAGGNQKWRDRLIGDRTPPYVTDEVAQQLGTVDIRNVPDGRYEGYEALKTAAYDVAVKVDYQQGWSMVLYLITDGTEWQIYAYDKWEE